MFLDWIYFLLENQKRSLRSHTKTPDGRLEILSNRYESMIYYCLIIIDLYKFSSKNQKSLRRGTIGTIGTIGIGVD